MPDRRTAIKQALGGAVLLPYAIACDPTDATSQTPSNPRVRRPVTALSDAERGQYVNAVLALKATQSPFDPSLSYYDHFVAFHREAVRYARVTLGYSVAHETPAFLPWHRKMLLLFEDAIRSVGFPDFTLPYWDWTDPEAEAVIFSDGFMGPLVGDPSDNYAVHRGPFRKGRFPLHITPMPIGSMDDESQSPFTFLTRGPKTVELPTAQEIEELMALRRYSAPPYDNSVDYSQSFNNTLLGLPNEPGMQTFMHSAVHVYVGGAWEGTYADAAFHARHRAARFHVRHARELTPPRYARVQACSSAASFKR